MSAKSDAEGKHTIWTRVALGLMLLTGVLSPAGSRAAGTYNSVDPGRETALSPTPLPSEELPGKAILLHFGASVQDGQVIVEWETAAETTAVGFYLYRQDPDAGTWVQVNEGIVPSFLGTATGGIYRVLDPEARPGGTLVYSLEEIRIRGQESRHGPFTATVERAAASTLSAGLAAAGYEQVPHPADLPVRPAQPEPNRSTDVPRALPGTEIAPTAVDADPLTPRIWLPLVTSGYKGAAPGLAKLRVREDGLYFLAAEDIATVFGLSVAQVADLIAATGLKLTTGGLDVATLPAAGNAGLYFYGQGIDSIYTWDNVYWLEVGTGTLMGTVAETPPAPVPMTTFTETVHVEENLLPATGLFDDPASDYWMWDVLVAGDAAMGRKSFDLQANGVAQTGATSLTLQILGLTTSVAGAHHHVQILLNGTSIGEAVWTGATPYDITLPVTPTLLHDGTNTVEVVGMLDAGVPYSVLYVNSFDLSYDRTTRAVNDGLAFASADGVAATIYGFSSPDIMAFDISDPLHPSQIVAVTMGAADSTYAITFKPAAAGMLYLAVATTAVPRITTLIADGPSALKGSNGADYVIITTADLSSSAGALAAYRQAQGLLPMVIDIEDVYDEFNYGVASPHALRNFLTYAYAHWSLAPHHVVLAGAGSYDYKDYLGYGDSLVPPILVHSINALAAADGRYADVVDDDGAPELVVGRLPVLTPAEFDAYVAKLQAYEAADPTGWSKQVLMLADNLDPAAGDFPADSAVLADTLPAGYTALEVYLGPVPLLSATEAHSQTLAALSAGVGVFNYLGHGAPSYLAAEKLLTVADVPNLQNSPRLAFVSAPTCTAGNYAVPGFRSLNVLLVLQADGGVAVAFSPTGESFNDHGVAVDTWLFGALFGGTLNRVGDATHAALAQFAAGGGARYVLDTYNLLGDPAMVMRWH